MNPQRIQEIKGVALKLKHKEGYVEQAPRELKKIVEVEVSSQKTHVTYSKWDYLSSSIVCVALMESAIIASERGDTKKAYKILTGLVESQSSKNTDRDYSFLGTGLKSKTGEEETEGRPTMKIDTAGRIREDIQSFEDALLEKLILPKPGETVEKKLSVLLDNTSKEDKRYSGFVKRISEVFGGTGDKAYKEYRFLGKQAKKAVAKTFVYPDSRYKIVAITPDVPASAVQELYTALFGEACVAVGTILDGQMNIYLSKAYANAV